MSEKIAQESKKQKIVKVASWSELEQTELLDLLALSSEIDPEFYEMVLKRVPFLMKETKKLRKSVQKNTKMAMKLSKSSKKYYYKISKSILKLLHQDGISPELKLELIDLLKETTLKMEKADERDKTFFNHQQTKTVGYSTLALLAIGAIYGVKAIKKD